eukprot:COSAG05_NODE_3972_length_1744_cov_1.410942_1_plen_82_part_00
MGNEEMRNILIFFGRDTTGMGTSMLVKLLDELVKNPPLYADERPCGKIRCACSLTQQKKKEKRLADWLEFTVHSLFLSHDI